MDKIKKEVTIPMVLQYYGINLRKSGEKGSAMLT